MLDKLSEALKNSMRKFISAIFVDETTLNQFVNEIQRALLQADVDVSLVFKISEDIKKRAREEIGKGQVAKEHIVKIVYEELVKVLGEEGYKIQITTKPFKILMLGLFGQGKTTTIAKIAHFFQKRGYKVCSLALDVFRPAAYEQLVQLGQQINMPVYGDPNIKDPLVILKKYEDVIKKFDIVIVDSSGRNALDQSMIDEITSIEKALQPQEVLLVQGADIGQAAKEQVSAFAKALKITGVVLTKMDGTAKGGGAITACSIAKVPVKFIGVGEKINDIEAFEPKRFVSRLLGLGDLESLLEKAKEVVKTPDKDLEQRIMSGKFNLNDYAAQLEAMSKMGSISKLISMIPGLGMANIPKELLNMQEEKLKKFKHILNSMTKEERENPEIIHRSRMERIARGSGTDVSDVKELLNQFNQIKKVMKSMKGKDIQKLAKRFGGKLPKLPFGM